MIKLFEDNKIVCLNNLVSCFKCHKITKASENYKMRICTIGKQGIEKIEIMYYCEKCGEFINEK